MNALSDLPKRTDITLAPGEFYFGSGWVRLHTLLGSCISITLWHPAKQCGGMCHYLLPTRRQNRNLPRGNFADDVIEMFLNEIKKVDTRPEEYEVKIFGGGNMFEVTKNTLKIGKNLVNVPQANINVGLHLLHANGFKVKAKDVGTIHHRKIYMELWNGDVWVRRAIK